MLANSMMRRLWLGARSLHERGSRTFTTTPDAICPLFIVDAFASKPFTGNPAAVCLVDDENLVVPHAQVAMEMNLSETAFVSFPSPSSGPGSGDGWSQNDTFDLRWFTPTVEVDLCGHATLAAAHVIFHERGNCNSSLRFNTRSGELVATRTRDGGVELDFPENRPDLVGTLVEVTERAVPAAAAVWSAILEESLAAGGRQRDFQLHATAGAAYNSRTGKLILRLSDDTPRTVLESLRAPPSALLAATAEIDGGAVESGSADGRKDRVQGVAVTLLGSGSPGDDSVDFCSRYFNPWWGIPEDPVNGSSHTVLAGFWEQCGLRGSGSGDESPLLRALVCSARGGELGVRASGGRVFLRGTAATSVEGTLRLPRYW